MSDSEFSLLNDAVKHITSALKVDAERIKATFSFLPPPKTNNTIMALAIEKILNKYFKAPITDDYKNEMESGSPAVLVIEDASSTLLPPRKISSLLSPNRCYLSVEGAGPIPGKDGYSELFYNWQKEAGIVDEIGNIDLKRTNTFTGVNQGDQLAIIHLATEGQAGVTVDGKRIKQKVGKSIKVKLDERTIGRTDDPETSTYHLYAACSGVVKAVFTKFDDPKTLSKINIHDTVAVNGDVNYGIGNQGSVDGQGDVCPFNIDIHGNVKGAFSLQSNGFIHVAGTIEGKSVTAQEITAQLLTGRCIATAEEKLTVQSIVNATANAREIFIEKNASGSTLKSSELTTIAANANCVGVSIETKRLEFINNNITGKNHVYFTQVPFIKLRAVNKQIKQTEREVKQLTTPNKELATAILTDIARLQTVASKTKSSGQKQILSVIDELKLTVINAIQSTGKQISNDIIGRCHKLQQMLGEAKYHESLLMKVDSLAAHIKKYNISASQLGTATKGDPERRERSRALEQEIREELIITLHQPKLIGHSAALHVHCGEVEELYTIAQLRGNIIEIQYIAPRGEEDISKGKLKLRAK